MRKLSPIGEHLIKYYEQCRLTAYDDGGGVWTIGWGHTKGVKPGDTCTKEQADAWFDEDVEEALGRVRDAVTIEINQNQFDALASFEYNTGALKSSTLLKKLNLGDFVGAAREFTRWTKDNGVELKGLRRRRLSEQSLFMAF